MFNLALNSKLPGCDLISLGCGTLREFGITCLVLVYQFYRCPLKPRS